MKTKKRFTLFVLFFISYFLKRLDKNIRDYGFVEAFARIIRYASRGLILVRDEETFRTLKEEGVLLITNHPAETDALLLLSSMPQRREVFIIINSVFISLLPSFDPHCIPVYVNYRLKSNRRAQFLQKINPTATLSEEESKELNRKSIDTAAQKIHEGGVVLFAPGYGNNDNEFRRGLGFMLNSLPQPDKVKIVMTYIRGTSKRDYLRIIPLLGKLMPRFRVDYSEALSAKEYVSSDPAKDTLKLQEKYFSWVNSLEYNR